MLPALVPWRVTLVRQRDPRPPEPLPLVHVLSLLLHRQELGPHRARAAVQPQRRARARDRADRAGAGASRHREAQDPLPRRPRGHLLEPRPGGYPVAALQLRRHHRTSGDGGVRRFGRGTQPVAAVGGTTAGFKRRAVRIGSRSERRVVEWTGVAACACGAEEERGGDKARSRAGQRKERALVCVRPCLVRTGTVV